MNNISLWETVHGSILDSIPCVLLVVVEKSGSGPGSVGSAMAVTALAQEGTVGGGAMELDLTARARELLEAGSDGPVLVEHRHSEERTGSGGVEDGVSSGLICSGSQTTALVPVSREHLDQVDRLMAALRRGKTGSLAIDPVGMRFSFGDYADTSFRRNESGDDWRFTASVGYRDQVYIVGGGHVGKNLAELLARLPFGVTVLDPRPEEDSCLKAGCRWVRVPFSQAHRHIREGSGSWVVVMTPEHVFDEEVLNDLSGMQLRYVGMMASESKRSTIFTNLEKRGADSRFINGVHSPVGLPVGSRTPFEIAVSIAAQLIGIRSGKLEG